MFRRIADFAPHDHFYLLDWARDLQFEFPFLDGEHIEHPYALFYYIWKLSFAFGRRFGHYSLAYEDLIAHPREELEKLFGLLRIEQVPYGNLLGLIETSRPGNWQKYADDDWFLQHERTCDAVLANFFGVEPPSRAEMFSVPLAA